MKISHIAVHGLFARFNHDIPLNPDERITFMLGPNGFGKTMILRILDVLFNRSPRSLGRMPFRELRVYFDDDSSLTVVHNHGGSSPKLSYGTSTHQEKEFEPRPLSTAQDVAFPLSAVEEFIPGIERFGPAQWRNVHTGSVLDLDDVITTYADVLPFEIELPQENLPSWLKDIRASLPVRLIDTERLTEISSDARRLRQRSHYYYVAPERTVRLYSEKLANMVRQTLTEYATLSQSLDRTFPARLVEEPVSSPLPTAQLAQVLKQVEKRRAEIVEAGLLPHEHQSLDVSVEKIDDSTSSVLAVYAKDATKKLEVFDDLYARANAFVRIANERLLYKQVSVSQEGLKVSNSDCSNLELEMLSSGEQHEIVLLFDLLFGTKENSLILIDEPEISLHVAWQRKMLKDLQEIAELSDFRALLATHSPQIIGDRWDLTTQLQGPEEE